jgi:hypothetical protein
LEASFGVTSLPNKEKIYNIQKAQSLELCLESTIWLESRTSSQLLKMIVSPLYSPQMCLLDRIEIRLSQQHGIGAPDATTHLGPCNLHSMLG